MTNKLYPRKPIVKFKTIVKLIFTKFLNLDLHSRIRVTTDTGTPAYTEY